MEREFSNNDLIDLGAVSAETKGPSSGTDDVSAGRIPLSGLSDE